MKYVKYKPDPLLGRFIDFYWVLHTDLQYKPFKVPLFADTCMDIFINAGRNLASFNDLQAIYPNRMYMGGLSASPNFINCFPDSTFIGIRFKAAGLSAFYSLPFFEIVDQIIEFHDNDLFLIIDVDEALPNRLNQYFLSKKKEAGPIFLMTEAAQYYHGQLSVDCLAERCNISRRTMERHFYSMVGVGPKELLSIVRFRTALQALQNGQSRGGLLQLAHQTGYYDQAHFIREVKKTLGLNPVSCRARARFSLTL